MCPPLAKRKQVLMDEEPSPSSPLPHLYNPNSEVDE
uniref:Uncharacterized protein n=1 Tax=Ascaris lumbricoides TaxID=6252 RepID=A0A0M3IBG8_ASCLU